MSLVLCGLWVDNQIVVNKNVPIGNGFTTALRISGPPPTASQLRTTTGDPLTDDTRTGTLGMPHCECRVRAAYIVERIECDYRVVCAIDTDAGIGRCSDDIVCHGHVIGFVVNPWAAHAFERTTWSGDDTVCATGCQCIGFDANASTP